MGGMYRLTGEGAQVYPKKNTGSLWMTRMARSRLRSSGTGNPFTRMEPDGESSLCAQTLTLRVRGAQPEPVPRYRNVAAVTTGPRNKQGMGRSGVGPDPIGAAQRGEHAFIGAAAGHQQVPPYAVQQFGETFGMAQQRLADDPLDQRLTVLVMQGDDPAAIRPPRAQGDVVGRQGSQQGVRVLHVQLRYVLQNRGLEHKGARRFPAGTWIRRCRPGPGVPPG